MNIMKKLLVLCILSISLSACNKVDFSLPIEGHWTLESYTENGATFKRTDALPSKEYGFSFLNNGIFLENKNAGWCGTPPITYGVFEGNWIYLSENLIDIDTESWCGPQEMEFVILALTNESLRIEVSYK